MPAADLPVTIADIHAAAERLAGAAVPTPLLDSPDLDARAGRRVLVKAETLQRTGSFKFRGAYATVAGLTAAQRARGVAAYSSGNHGQAVACAARLLGCRAVIVMPADAPAAKIARTRGHGAEVVLYDRHREDRVALGEAIARREGLELIRPYDDPRVIAGQGTLGLEITAQAADRGETLDAVVVCTSGGGIVAGCAVALAATSAAPAVYAAEPATFDDTARSLAAGKRVGAPWGRSIADALLVDQPGEITFAINRRLLAGSLTVSDAALARAMRVAFEDLRLVVEPGGAAALAAVLERRLPETMRTVAVVLTGGNVDLATFHHLAQAGADA